MIYYQHHFELSWDYGEAQDFKVTSFYSCDTSISTFLFQGRNQSKFLSENSWAFKKKNHRNRDIKFSKSQNNWYRLDMFKATEIERKIREINLLINMQTNLSSCTTSDHYFLCVSSHCHGTRQELKMYYVQTCAKVLEDKQIMVAEKRQQNSHCIYHPEIIQTSSMVRMQKKSLEHNDCLYVASITTLSQETHNGQHPQPIKLLSSYHQSVILIIKSIGTTLQQFA